MKTYILDFLRALEAEIQPPKNCHHAITFAKYGSDSDGWSERLAVQVNDGGKFYAFFLDDDDFSSPAHKLANEIALLHAKQMPDRQEGVALGQYAAS